ncbi:MAG: hypothetical protein DBX91_04885 [Subdoligranulum variabile]|nr:MAG: hypothetical protein DBX91_04885 [Subdoligranulum variabile]
MKRAALFFGAFVVGLAAACLTAVLLLAPGRLREEELQDLRPQAVATPTPTPTPTPAPLAQMDFSALLARNPDVVGWISIDDTPVDYPVVQGTDNEYYLHHDLDGAYDALGVPFADYECDVEHGRHLILYGHNMGEGRSERFSSLQGYRDPDYYTRHPVIRLDTLYGSALYKVVAVYALSARTDDPDYFPFNTYVDFSDEEAEQQYLDEVARRAFYTTGDYARAGERLLTLCFCTYEMEDARMLVMARPLRDGESTEADEVHSNPDPQLPSRWPRAA